MSRRNLKEEFIVAGYIHIIQTLLSSTLIIPLSICQLCNDYYYDAQRKIFIYKNKKIEEVFIYKNRGSIPLYKHAFDQFNIDYIGNKNNITLTSINFNKSLILNKHDDIRSLCYIPNASNLLSKDIVNKKHSDGIFSVVACRTNISRDVYPVFLFFDNRTLKKTVTHILRSKVSMKVITRNIYILSLFCGNNGIIYELHSDLYQLKLQNIESNNCNKFMFNKMKIENDTFWKFKHNSKFLYEYLDMCYIPRENKLFAVENHCRREKKMSNSLKNYSKKSAIFDFNNNKWINIKPFKYTSFCSEINKNRFESALYYNDNNNSIYMLTMSKKTNILISKYDLNKDKWIHIQCNDNLWDHDNLWDRFHTVKPILWLDNKTNILQLYKAPNSYAYMDLSEKNKQWVTRSDNTLINDQYTFYEAFC
eukprot:26369_1